MERMMPRWGWALAALLAVPVVPAGVRGQTLDRVEGLIQEGRMEDARDALVAWEGANRRPGREDRQRGLWYKGLLTLDPIQAEIIYRQLILEYPGGSYTDQALLRVGTAAALRGDLLEAEVNFRHLERDYPGSPARLEAVDWLRRNQEALAAAREGPAAEPAPGAARPGAVAAEAGGSGDFTAQLGALSTLEAARALAARVREAGFTPRIAQVEGSDLFRVRVGRFETMDQARELVRRLRDAGLEAAVGTGALRERPVG